METETTNKMILVKYLYEHAKQHASNNTSLDRIIAVHNLDNAIEWLLKDIALKIEVEIFDKKNKQYYNFHKLWEQINEKLSKSKKSLQLPLKEDIFGLHDLRNKVQHHANIPSQEDLQRYLSSSQEFINKSLKDIFNIDYDSLYLSSLIENKELRQKFTKAEEAFNKESYKECVDLCSTILTDASWGTETLDGIAPSAGKLTGFFGASEELKEIIKTDYPTSYRLF